MIFGRVKPLDAILATAEKKSLHRSLGAFQLTLFGIGCIIGTGIFVLTAAGAQKAGPGLMLAFIIAGAVCIVAALCYAEIAAMIPVAGSAYTYTYACMGEFLAWTVGWALVLEYAVARLGGVGRLVRLFHRHHPGAKFGIAFPAWLSAGPLALGGAPGRLHQPAGADHRPAVTWLLMIGTSESAKVNAVLVAIKVTALTAFIILTLPVDRRQFQPVPAGRPVRRLRLGRRRGRRGGDDLLRLCRLRRGLDRGRGDQEPAAQRADRPDRSLAAICTIFYILVAAGASARSAASRSWGQRRAASRPARRARPPVRDAAICRDAGLLERGAGPRAAPDRLRHRRQHARLRGLLALPSVILILLFGQTRIFFVMARDGLLPEALSKVHPKWKTPHVVTIITGLIVAIAAAFFPVGQLADIANAGTLYAFLMVAIAVMACCADRARPQARLPGAGGRAGRPADDRSAACSCSSTCRSRRCWCCRSGPRSGC
jgi:APA family basic amino acid/polyamine antiporter